MRDLILSSGSLFPMRHEGEEDILKILSKSLVDSGEQMLPYG